MNIYNFYYKKFLHIFFFKSLNIFFILLCKKFVIYPDTVLKFNKFLDRIYDDTDLLRKNIYEDLTYKMYNNSKKLNIKI